MTSQLTRLEEAQLRARVAGLEKELQNQRDAAFHHHERAEQALARVAELEAEQDAIKSESLMPWEELTEKLKARAEQAEQRNAELVTALRKLARPYVEAACDRTYDGAQGYELRKTAKERLEAINALLARAESAAPDVY